MKSERYDESIISLKEKLFLSGNSLKIIAIIAMTIDHLAWMNIAEYNQAETPTQIFFPVKDCFPLPRRKHQILQL